MVVAVALTTPTGRAAEHAAASDIVIDTCVAWVWRGRVVCDGAEERVASFFSAKGRKSQLLARFARIRIFLAACFPFPAHVSCPLFWEEAPQSKFSVVR